MTMGSLFMQYRINARIRKDGRTDVRTTDIETGFIIGRLLGLGVDLTTKC